jgi:hypothetical protein
MIENGMKTALFMLLLLMPLVVEERIDLKLDTAEADAVLAIIDKHVANEPITDADWVSLFATAPYRRLKSREASMRRDFADEDFKQFVGTLDDHGVELRRALNAWKKADLRAAAERSLHYLPVEARIQATVYPMIKPKPNSFVFETTTDPTIFLYLDPAIPQEAFENTVAHELHHIGLASLDKAYEERVKTLPPTSHKVAQWMGAFGEGVAMLAAAGSADVHPVVFPASDRQRWDDDMKFFATEQAEVDQFFLDIIHGDFKNLEAADHEASTFFGYRGPWYVVGYRMAVTIEKQFGRTLLIRTLLDSREFVAKYNDAAAIANVKGSEKLPLFSAEILEAVGVAQKR